MMLNVSERQTFFSFDHLKNNLNSEFVILSNHSLGEQRTDQLRSVDDR